LTIMARPPALPAEEKVKIGFRRLLREFGRAGLNSRPREAQGYFPTGGLFM
jgi:hypothetical protein